MISNFVTQTQKKVRIGPAGIHVFDRTTGLNLLLDEYSVPSIFWATAPRQVSIALTNICDLSCPYCYVSKNSNSLEFERVTAWLVELDKAGCLGIGFGGGEPTLYRRFAELCHYAAKNTQLAITFTTHSHRINDSLISSLAGSINFVRISMDGVGETYEMLRGRSFVDLCHQLKRIRKLAPFGINYVVNSRTFPDLNNAIKVAVETGATEFLLLPEQSVNGVGGIDTDTARLLCKWVLQYQGVIQLVVSETGSDGMPVCNPVVGEDGLRAYAHIDASGTVKKTSFDSGGVVIGPEGVIHALEELRGS